MPVIRDLAYAAAAVASSPLWGYRLLRTGKWRTDWPSRFGHTHLSPTDRPTLLIHAVSVGEVNATRRLVDELTARHRDDLRIVISATTDTGIARARQLYETRHEVVRYPLDFTRSVRRFLDAVAPDAVALMELELWPTFIGECVKRDIPVAVINGRLSARSFATYRRFRPMLRGMFASLSAAAVQDEAYAARFATMGVPADRIKVMGTMKWDTEVIEDDVPGSAELAAEMGINRDRPVIVCGSTGPGEEKMFVEALAGLADSAGRAAQLIIVPRKPERFDEAAAAMGSPVRRTQARTGLPSGASRQVPSPKQHAAGNLFLIDTMGEQRKAYALADVAVVGRSFCPLYGSSVTEPIALGKPTVVGPNTSDFADTMAKLLAGDGIIQLPDINRLRETVALLLGTERGRQLASNGRDVILSQQGATQRHATLLDGLLQSQGAG
jgi:3-deoxy-D-manno-octulosonic-acid transferase